MAKYVAQVEEIGRQVAAQAGPEVEAQVMAGIEQIKSSSKPDKVAHWVQGAMEKLDTLVDEETRSQVMQQCGRNCAHANKVAVARQVARRKKYATLDEYLAAEEKHPSRGTRLVRDGNLVHQFYTPGTFRPGLRCYCSLVNGLPAGETISLTYCQCSRGFVQTCWEAVLERRVQVELVKSCMSGADECEFLIHL